MAAVSSALCWSEICNDERPSASRTAGSKPWSRRNWTPVAIGELQAWNHIAKRSSAGMPANAMATSQESTEHVAAIAANSPALKRAAPSTCWRISGGRLRRAAWSIDRSCAARPGQAASATECRAGAGGAGISPLRRWSGAPVRAVSGLTCAPSVRVTGEIGFAPMACEIMTTTFSWGGNLAATQCAAGFESSQPPFATDSR